MKSKTKRPSKHEIDVAAARADVDLMEHFEKNVPGIRFYQKRLAKGQTRVGWRAKWFGTAYEDFVVYEGRTLSKRASVDIKKLLRLQASDVYMYLLADLFAARAKSKLFRSGK